MGLGIYIPTRFIRSERPADKDNYGYVIRTATNRLNYAIAFNSDNEEFGMHSEKDWFDWLKTWKSDLQTPLLIK